MALNVNSGRTTADISGSVTTLNGPPAGAVQIMKSVRTATTGTVIHTVTAGKTFYLQGYALSEGTAGANVVDLLCNAVIVASSRCGATLPGAVVSAGASYLFTVAATQTVSLATTSGAGNTTVSIWGYEL